MTGRRAVIGLCTLCALVFSAIAAQSASAEGTTAFTCRHEAGGYGDAHCNTKGGIEIAKKVAIGPTASTRFEGTNRATGFGTASAVPAVLKATVAGTMVEIECTTVSSTGTLENQVFGGVMRAKSPPLSPTTITYAGCVVKKPKTAEIECKVHSLLKPAGTVESNEVTGETVSEAGEKMYVTVKEHLGEPLAEIIFEAAAGKKCPEVLTKAGLRLKGTAALDASGATLTSPSTVAASTLVLGGFAATLISKETLRMHKEGGETQEPIFLDTE